MAGFADNPRLWNCTKHAAIAVKGPKQKGRRRVSGGKHEEFLTLKLECINIYIEQITKLILFEFIKCC